MTLTPDQYPGKLAFIAAMPRDQMDGYEAEAKRRGMFPGEAAAIIERRKSYK